MSPVSSWLVWSRGILLIWLLAGAAPVQWTFREAFDAAWSRYPDRPGIEAQRVAALARARTARGFFPNAPTVTGTYFDDHAIGSNQGYTTYQGEVSTPIWLPGEGTATERVANADARTFVAQSANAQLTVAAAVLDAAVVATQAQQELIIANRKLGFARRVAAEVGHAARVGELSGTDLDAVQAELDSAVISQSNAAAGATNAIAALAVFTGSPEIPTLEAFAELQPAPAGVDRGAGQEDPRTLVMERRLETAREQLRLVRASPMADPDVGFDGIREKQFGSPWDTRVGVVIRVPLPSPAINRSRLALAQSAVTVAEGELLRVHREVELGMVQTEISLRAARAAQASAIHLASDLNRRAGSMERAWLVGETTLIEFLRARQAAFDADRQGAWAGVSAHAAVLRAALATGMVPP